MRISEDDGAKLRQVLSSSIANRSIGKLGDLLAAHSNLPGPRGNLELGKEFALAVSELPPSQLADAWEVCSHLARVPAPTGDPGEFEAFCGALGIAALGCRDVEYRQQSIRVLRRLAGDDRWRMREAVAMGIQDLISTWGVEVARSLGAWISESDWLAMRAVAAGLAEPRLLTDRGVLRIAIQHHRRIVARILAARDRRSSQFKALRKGLGYTLSVLAAKAPEEGFGLMEEMIGFGDRDLRWIVSENLRKGRIRRAFPRDVGHLRSELDRTR